MAAFDRIGWWWHRLRAMSPDEVRWRLHERSLLRAEAGRAGRESYAPLAAPRGDALRAALAASLAPLVPPTSWRDALRGEFSAHRAHLEGAAREARAGRVAIYARVYDAGVPTRWRTDPKSGAETPARAAARLDYRDRAISGNARRIWELNRHHHLAEAAQWAWAAEDTGTGRWVAQQLSDWCAKNPPLVGVNWTSALELAIRTLAWAEIVALLGDLGPEALPDDNLEEICGAWARQVEHVRVHDSRFSSANNHRIGEAAAVAVAGLAMPFHPDAGAWWQWGAETLDEELVRQIATDGAGREQAFAYQRFVVDFALLVRVLARGHGRDLGPEARERVGAACDFLEAVTRDDGAPFPVGDDDEGRAFALGETYEERTLATLECAGWLYGKPEWRRARLPRSRWLGLAEDEAPRTVDPAAERAAGPVQLRVYPEGGYAVARGGGAHLVFDAGPLGFGALAAHGHADALSLCLRLGEDLLVDPGTGSYHGDPEWREALRGTRAHNTLELGGRDQSERRGLFLWGRRARARLLAAGAGSGFVVLAGEHDGYAGLGVAKTRRLVVAHLEAGRAVLLVVDEAIGGVRTSLRAPWHLGEGTPAGEGGAPDDPFRIRYPHGAGLVARFALLAHHGGVVAEQYRGGDAVDGGYAPRFEERCAQGVVALRADSVRLPATMSWAIVAYADCAAGEIAAPQRRDVSGGVEWRCAFGDGRVLRALVAAPSSDAVDAGEARLDGRLAAWIESDGELPAAAVVAVAGARALRAGGHTWRAPGEPVSGVVMRAATVAANENSEGSAR
jgi:hypothetical protein